MIKDLRVVLKYCTTFGFPPLTPSAEFYTASRRHPALGRRQAGRHLLAEQSHSGFLFETGSALLHVVPTRVPVWCKGV